ncbi:glycoside hydrolase family 2 protein [Herbiconiux daphne]|uniref:Beta-galactosidase n=1 Tax=Herbiconiux daphne TaxID=2970914 RepID=A0ABT2H021_9MICO|nr:glycoside hydrolase family 2 TIM barrel-domain containing protein [Herbiconiux daphne]MCS5732521.1 hypothetical protein [Herbiconiux daphne]
MTHETTTIPLDTDWLFGGEIPLPGAEDALDPARIAEYADPDLDDSGWQPVTLPHTVTPLSWKLWNPATWEKVWAYRRRFATPDTTAGERVFVEFDGAMTTAVVALNGVVLGTHQGGYLPFAFEITDGFSPDGDNVLTVVLDSRFNLNVPPNITAPALSSSIDYAQPGGIHRSARMRITPPSFIEHVALSHHDVLDPAARRTEIVVTIDASAPAADALLTARLFDREGAEVAKSVSEPWAVSAGRDTHTLELTDLGGVQLWDLDDPVLYTIEVTLSAGGDAASERLDRHTVRTGYREARFEPDGFFLNGVRRYLMGVNRHGYFPFAGFSMPDRVHRHDAEIIKNDLNCQIVRCSHYPQTESFLDACDELGLLVWEESPGWQHVGDSLWQDRAADDIEKMIARDRHRPSVVVWAARLNETPDRPEFYARTEALVKRLDPTRQTSGTTHGDYARAGVFQHDVFSYDDYTTRVDDDGERRPVLLPPADERPYLVSEAISTRSSPTTLYRRADGARVQQHQALDYAYGHDDARGDRRFSGLIAWVGFDYEANMGNHYRGVKTSGLGDVFRILKPGGAIYRSQVSPHVRPVAEPAFTWDPPEFGQANAFGDRAEGRLWGPGERAMICSNLDRLDVYLGDRLAGSVAPDRARFPHLDYAPSFVDLTILAGDGTDLRIDGFLDGERVLQRRFSGDRSGDSFALTVDHPHLVADGADATRVEIAVVDRFGEARGSSRERIEFTLDGPGTLVGESPFDLEDTGAVGAVWVRTHPGVPGVIALTATTRELGSRTVMITSHGAGSIPDEERTTA